MGFSSLGALWRSFSFVRSLLYLRRPRYCFYDDLCVVGVWYGILWYPKDADPSVSFQRCFHSRGFSSTGRYSSFLIFNFSNLQKKSSSKWWCFSNLQYYWTRGYIWKFRSPQLVQIGRDQLMILIPPCLIMPQKMMHVLTIVNNHFWCRRAQFWVLISAWARCGITSCCWHRRLCWWVADRNSSLTITDENPSFPDVSCKLVFFSGGVEIG